MKITRNPRLKWIVIILVVILVIAAGYLMPTIIRKFSVDPILNNQPDELTENKIRPDVEEKIFNTDEYKTLLKKFSKNKDKK